MVHRNVEAGCVTARGRTPRFCSNERVKQPRRLSLEELEGIGVDGTGVRTPCSVNGVVKLLQRSHSAQHLTASQLSPARFPLEEGEFNTRSQFSRDKGLAPENGSVTERSERGPWSSPTGAAGGGLPIGVVGLTPVHRGEVVECPDKTSR